MVEFAERNRRANWWNGQVRLDAQPHHTGRRRSHFSTREGSCRRKPASSWSTTSAALATNPVPFPGNCIATSQYHSVLANWALSSSLFYIGKTASRPPFFQANEIKTRHLLGRLASLRYQVQNFSLPDGA
jgi:hypothetical protein